jgi:hypothetical protein
MGKNAKILDINIDRPYGWIICNLALIRYIVERKEGREGVHIADDTVNRSC